MIDPILASFSSIGPLFQIARPFQDGAIKAPAGQVDPTQARGRTVADQVDISPEARRAADQAGGVAGSGGAPGSGGVAGAGGVAEPEGANEAAGAGEAEGPDEAPSTDHKVEAELRQLRQLRQRDQDVRAHEAAHKAAAGQYGGAISYNYETGPDGKRYAVGGSVSIDVSPVPGDPRATVRKMEQVMRAALAPGDPSPADRQIATQAASQLQSAQGKLATTQAGSAIGLQAGKSCSPQMTNPYQMSQASQTATASSLVDTSA
jgi:hypothetical protein